MRPKGFGAFFWALVLMAIGTILLLRNFGYDVPVWQTLAVYWPALLIGWGLVKIIDYYRFRGLGRRLFSAGEVVLLVLVLLLGATYTAAAHLTSTLGGLGITLAEDFDLFNLLGESHEFTETLTAEAGPSPRIQIENTGGSVDVVGTDGERIVVEVVKTVRAGSRQDAERMAPELRVTLTERNGTWIVESNRDRMAAGMRSRFTTSLRIQAPQGSSLSLRNQYGAVRVADLGGEQSIENRYGASSVRSIDGSVRIVSRYGAVSAQDVSGDLEVENRYGPVTASTIGGIVSVENRQGAVRISGVDGSITVTNRYSPISIRDGGGGIYVEGRNSAVDVFRVVGGARIETLYRDVDVREVAGPIEVVNRHGDTRLTFVAPPASDVSITGEYSDVRIDLPPDSSFSLDAQIRSGSFQSDFDGMDSLPAGRSLRVTGQQGTGGPRITIMAERGEVRVTH